MPRLGKTLVICGKAWLWIAFAFIGLNYLSILVFSGFSELQRIMSPFNLWNVLAVGITLAPGLFLLALGERLIARNPSQ